MKKSKNKSRRVSSTALEIDLLMAKRRATNIKIRERRKKLLSKHHINTAKKIALPKTISDSIDSIASVISYIDNSKIMLERRKSLKRRMRYSIKAVNSIISLLPDRFMLTASSPQISITNEICKVQRRGQGILNALIDRKVKSDDAIDLIGDWRGTLANLLELFEAEQPNHVLSQDIIKTKETISAIGNQPKILIKDFNELGNYKSLFDSVQQKLAILENASAPVYPNQKEINKVFPKKEAGYLENDPRAQQFNSDATQLRNSLKQAAESLPQIKIKAGSKYNVVQKVPLLVVTERFLSDSIISSLVGQIVKDDPTKVTTKKSGLYERLLTFLHGAPVPGAPPPRTSESSFVILYNQILLVLPLVVAADPATLGKFRAEEFASLQNTIGKMQIIPVGRATDKAQDFVLPDGNGRQAMKKYMKNVDKKQMSQLKLFFTDKRFPGLALFWILPQNIAEKLRGVVIKGISLPNPNFSDVENFSPSLMERNRQDAEKENLEKILELKEKRQETEENILKEHSLPTLTQQKLQVIKKALDIAQTDLNAKLQRKATVEKEIALLQAALRSDHEYLQSSKNTPQYQNAIKQASQTLAQINELKAEANALNLSIADFVKTRDRLDRELTVIINEEKKRRFGK